MNTFGLQGKSKKGTVEALKFSEELKLLTTPFRIETNNQDTHSEYVEVVFCSCSGCSGLEPNIFQAYQFSGK